MLTDLRLALRRLSRARGFALVAVCTLALGLAATTAVFALLDAVALRPLPYPGAERLVTVSHAVPGVPQTGDWGISKANYFYYGRSPAIERLGIYAAQQQTLVGGDRATMVTGVWTSTSTLDLLGARAQLGRVLTAADEPRQSGGTVPVVLSDGAWRALFGADPRVVGRTLRLDDDPVLVVGVLAPVRPFPDLPVDVAVWAPMTLDAAAPAQNNHVRQGLARLRPGVTAADAERELKARAARMVELFPTAYSESFMRSTGFAPRVTPLREAAVGPVARVLWLVLGGVGLVLAIAAANVANLMLARREGRRAELAVQAALGADRARLVRDALAEGAVIAALSAVVALPLAALAVRVTVALRPDDLPLLDTARVDWRAALVCLGVALVAASGTGVLPLLGRGVGRGAAVLGGVSRTATAGRGRVGVRQALVVGQVALALVLVACAGLLLESVRRLRAVPPGFEVDHAMTTTVVMSSPGSVSDARAAAFWRTLETRLAGLPGVVAVGATTRVPLGDNGGCSGIVVDSYRTGKAEQGPCVGTARVTPGFFGAMGIAVRGATADWAAAANGAGTAIVTDALAARLWPGVPDPAGRGIGECTRGCPRDRLARVSGVAVGVRDQGLHRAPPELVYLPALPVAGDTLAGVPRGLALVVRVRPGLDPLRVAPAVRRVVAELDPGAPVGPVRTMRALLAESMARWAFTMTLLSVAATMAVLLAAVGLYGTLAYVVGLRRREIGVRTALGARATQVRGLVVRQSAALAAVGIALGTVGALGATRLLRSQLYGIEPGDPAVLAAGALLLVAIAAAASWVPAQRAARVDPVLALRGE